MAVAYTHVAAIFRFISFSPTGGFVSGLSATGLPGMSAAAAHRYDLFHIVAEQEPYLFPERHVGLEIGKKCFSIGPAMRVMMSLHDYFAPTRGRTLSI